MGEAILASLLRSGYKASEITVIEKRAERLLELTEKYQVQSDGIEGCDVVLLAVKFRLILNGKQVLVFVPGKPVVDDADSFLNS